MTETRSVAMDIRGVVPERREVVGVCVPYGMTSMATPSPKGERIQAGAFAKSIRQNGSTILLFREHGHMRNERPIGRVLSWEDGPTELVATFQIRTGAEGDSALEDFRDGYLPGLSVGFVPLNTKRADDGATVIAEARLMEVSGTALPAYEGAEVLAVRSASPLDVAALLGKMPEVNLSPLPPLWAYPHNS